MLYDYRCQMCGTDREAANSVAERHSNAPICCGQRSKLIIKTAVPGFIDREIHYVCPVTNEGVTSRRQRNNIMAREGLVDADPRQSVEKCH